MGKSVREVGERQWVVWLCLVIVVGVIILTVVDKVDSSCCSTSGIMVGVEVEEIV